METVSECWHGARCSMDLGLSGEVDGGFVRGSGKIQERFTE